MTTYIQFEFFSVYGGEFAFWGEPVPDNIPAVEEDKVEDFNEYVAPGQLVLLGPGDTGYKYVGEQMDLFDTNEFSKKLNTKFKWFRQKKAPRPFVKGFDDFIEVKQLTLIKVVTKSTSNKEAFLIKNAKRLAAKRERQARGAANHELALAIQKAKKINKASKHNRLEARRQAKAATPSIVSYEARRRAFLEAKGSKKSKTRKIKSVHGIPSWPRIGRRVASRLAKRYSNPVEYLPNGIVIVPEALSPKELRLWRDYSISTRQARIESARYLGLLPKRESKPKIKTPRPTLRQNRYSTLSWNDEGHAKRTKFGVGYKKQTPKFEVTKPNSYKHELLVQLGEIPILKKDKFKEPPKKEKRYKPKKSSKNVKEEPKGKYIPSPPKNKTKKVKAKKVTAFNAFAEDDSPKKKGKKEGKSSKNKCRKAGRAARKGTMYGGENSILGKKALKEFMLPVVNATVLVKQSEGGK